MSEDDSDTQKCEYVFEPKDCINVEPIRNDSWSCPYESIDGSNKCEYHSDNSLLSNEDTTEAEIFVRMINEDTKVFGSNFHSICVTDSLLEGIKSDKIEINNASFKNFEIKGAEFDKDFIFSGCEFKKFNDNASVNRRSRTYWGCYFENTFTSNPEVNYGRTSIKKCKFSGTLQIEGEYRDELIIDNSTFNNVVRLTNAIFKDGCDISESIFRGEMHVSSIDVPDEMQIKSVELPLRFIISDSNIQNIKLAPDRGLPSLVDLRAGTEISSGSLTNTEDKSVYYDLSYAKIGDVHIDLDNGDWDNYLFNNTKFGDFKFIDYEDKLIENDFEIHDFGYSEDLFFESRVFPDGIFERSDLLRTSLTDEKQVSPPDMLFVDVFEKDGNSGNENFMSKVKSALRLREKKDVTGSWYPADLFLKDGKKASDRVIASKNYRELTALRNQTGTYTRAKNHAQSNGIGSLVSGFHVLLNRAERKKYASRSRSSNSIMEKFSNRRRSSRNWFLRWLYKYGEGTYYPLFWSAVTIAVAATAYVKLGVIEKEPTTTTLFGTTVTHQSLNVWIESLQYSTLVFTTLGRDSISPQTLLQGTLISIQSAIGAVLIALFVFTLGRQASR